MNGSTADEAAAHWSNSMTDNHPMIPSLVLLQKWEDRHFDDGENYDVMLIEAYQAGADHELEACCKWLVKNDWKAVHQHLRAARRPKPPSLKAQGLKALDSFEGFTGSLEEVDIIRRALESLPD